MDTAMTDYQYRSIMNSIKMILDGCKSIEEAKEKIDVLIEKDTKTDNKEKK